MSGWDKRATTRRAGPPPSARDGAYLVYTGLSERARRDGIEEPASVSLGDAFRLLPGAVIALGRSDLCEVTIDAKSLSRRHAMVSFEPGAEVRLVLVDLNTRTGCWVEGRRAPVQKVAPGQTFELARYFCFRCQPAG